MAGFNNQSLEQIAAKLEQATINTEAIADKSYDEGYDCGYEEGQQDNHNSFWYYFSEGGKRKNYAHAFAGKYWNKNTFSPTYDISPSNSDEDVSSCMFDNFNDGNEPIDMVELTERCGISISFISAKHLQYALRGDGVSRWGNVDLRNATDVRGIFKGNGGNKLTQIDMIVTQKGTPWQYDSFENQCALKTVHFLGVIGCDLNLQWCPLDKKSFISVIECLSTSTSGKTLTLNRSAVGKAFETVLDSGNGIDSSEWNYYVNKKTNWNIEYV